VAFGLAMVLVGLAGVWIAVGAHPGHDVALWIALPLLIAGLGGGLVISPNLTLTLSQVPVERAGSAGGVLQTGQRIGSAAGIAVTGSVFYNRLASSHGDYASAFRHGIVSIAAFVAAALALALADAFTRNPRTPAEGGPRGASHEDATASSRAAPPPLGPDSTSLRYWCTKAIAMLPSPTAAATRLTGLNRTSPHANTPGTLVSSR
jgi:MFS family permease